jgi:GNAT superfamily N-acetyltransferase
MSGLSIRPAVAADVPALEGLMDRSTRALSQGFYSQAEIDAALAHVFGMDSELIADGTYLIACGSDGALLGCGGWSRRNTLFGGDHFAGRVSGLLDPATDAARIRAFFVAPEAARQGVGSRLLADCEARAQSAGFRRIALMSTLPGQPFYAAHGYVPGEPVTHRYGNSDLCFVPMEKALG